MRALLIAALSFAAGAGAFVWLLDGTAALIAAAAAMAGGALCTILRSRPVLRRAAVALFAAAVSLLYCTGYQALAVRPVQRAAAGQQTHVVEVRRASSRTSSGGSVEGELTAGGRTCRILLFYSGDAVYMPGDRISFSGTVRPTTGPEAGSTGRRYAARGIYLTAYLPEGAACEQASHTSLRDLPEWAAIRIRAVVRELYSDASAGLVCALLTGDRSGLSDAEGDAMSVTGVYHTVAVSGLHVSILIGLLSLLLRGNRRRTAAIGIPILAFFVLMTGASPSAVRAAVMQLLLLLAPLVRRENDPPTTLGAAALVILIGNPYAIASAAFQLSFLACAGILLLSERMQNAFLPAKMRSSGRKASIARRCMLRLWRGTAGILSVSLSAQLLTIPLSMWYFGRVSVLAPLTNLLTSAAVTGIFAFGAVSVLLGLIFLPLGIPAAAIAGVLTRYFLLVVRLLARLPFAALYDFSPYTVLFLLFLYTTVALLAFSRSRVRPVIPTCCTVIVLCSCVLLNAFTFAAAEFTFSALDVGQGQCLVISSGGASVMVDCGGDTGAIAAREAAAYLSSMGRTRLDVLVLTHFDADHTGGVPTLLERISVGQILAPDYDDGSGMYDAVVQAAAEADVPVTFLSASPAQIALGEGTVTVLPPVSYGSSNDACLSVLASFGDFDILATGDMDTDAEQLLLKMYALPDIEVLVAGHHGSRYSTGEALLEETRPETVIISVGENSYGHPAQQTLARIASVGADVCRTDEAGTITIRR